MKLYVIIFYASMVNTDTEKAHAEHPLERYPSYPYGGRHQGALWSPGGEPVSRGGSSGKADGLEKAGVQGADRGVPGDRRGDRCDAQEIRPRGDGEARCLSGEGSIRSTWPTRGKLPGRPVPVLW